MGGYDLYGNYYPREIDALNAEMAQCAQIDSSRMQRDMERAERHQYEREMELHYRIEFLERQVNRLLQAVGLAAEEQGNVPEQPTTLQGQNGTAGKPQVMECTTSAIA